MWPDLKEEIELELAQLRQLFDVFAVVRKKTESGEPDGVEMAALASFLHSFYNGVENISKRVAVHLDGGPPRGETWHSLLLDSVARASEGRPAVISEKLCKTLRDYLDFRHFFRHAYLFQLKWERMAPLVHAADDTFRQLEQELERFLSAIESKG